MRSLIIHANKFESKTVESSNKPVGIVPEEDKESLKQMEDCLLVLFCIEKEDSEKQVEQLYLKVLKDAKQVKVKNIMVTPFVHLSRNIASPDTAKSLYFLFLNKMKATSYNTNYSHFGYAKHFLIDTKGHRYAFKYREFY